MKAEVTIKVGDDGVLSHKIIGQLDRRDRARIKRSIGQILQDTLRKQRREQRAIRLERAEQQKAVEAANGDDE